jgi:hypothetical protein
VQPVPEPETLGEREVLDAAAAGEGLQSGPVVSED